MTVLFSDIDGTLIDHHTYDTRLAILAVEILKKKAIPLVFCSSKTFAEQVQLQQMIGIKQPMIVENGSGIVFPEGYFSKITTNSEPVSGGYRLVRLTNVTWMGIRDILKRLNQNPGTALRGFSDTTDEELSEATNLHGADLGRARQRMFTETLLPPTPDLTETTALQEAGLELSRGGRFVTLTGAGTNKGKALMVLAGWYLQEYGSQPTTMAVGDSPNDESMLVAADKAFLVKQPTGTWAHLNAPGMVKLDGIGPEGLLKMVQLL
ncbi:MAG: HAD-IIB family hydrolase [Saprospiraceae bacterium]|nr:HAD-IIB family hydrolase [Saprospiraceae bacterium]